MRTKTQARKASIQQDAAQVRQDYENAVDPGLIDFIEKVRAIPEDRANKIGYKVSDVSEKQRIDMEALIGGKVNAKANYVNGGCIRHIDKRHGENGEADHSMADIEDMARIGYVLKNYDNVDFLVDDSGNIKTDWAYTAQNGKAAPIIVFVKRINGYHSVIEAINDGKRGRLNIVSSYRSSVDPINGNKARMPDGASAPKLTPEAASATDINNTSKFTPKVNKNKTRMPDGTESPKQNVQDVSALTPYNNISYSAKNVNNEVKNSWVQTLTPKKERSA